MKKKPITGTLNSTAIVCKIIVTFIIIVIIIAKSDNCGVRMQTFGRYLYGCGCCNPDVRAVCAIIETAQKVDERLAEYNKHRANNWQIISRQRRMYRNK